MPSFLPVSCLRPILQFYIHQNRIRCLSKYLNAPLYQNKITGKRVLPFASLWVKGRKLDAFPAGKSFSYAEGRFVPASVTIEAALCLPLFLFFFMAVLEPIWWLDRQRKIQTTAEAWSEKLCQYSYLASRETEDAKRNESAGNKRLSEASGGDSFKADGKEAENPVNEEIQNAAVFLSEAAASLWLMGEAGQYADQLRIENAEVPDETGNIIFQLEYEEQIPFFPEAFQKVTMNVGVKKRAWIGLDGKLRAGSTETGDMAEEDREEPMVYVGSGMGRYHLSRDCHYLSNQYEAVSEEQAKEMRNGTGQKLSPCASCSPSSAGNGIVYVTPSGRHYHYKKSCSAMVSYVRRVPLKEVSHLGVCSYCGKEGSH